MFFKIAALKNFAIFAGKHLGWSLFLIKLQTFRPATLLKRDSNTGVLLLIFKNNYFGEHLRPAASKGLGEVDRMLGGFFSGSYGKNIF